MGDDEKVKVRSLEMVDVPKTAQFSWSNRPSNYIITAQHQRMPEERMDHSCTQVGKYIVIFGGTKGEDPNAPSKKNVAIALNSLYLYDMEKLTFVLPNVSGDVPKPRFRHSACADQDTGKVYVFGGIYGGNDIYSLDTMSDPMEWKILKTHGPTPRERHGHISCCYNGKLFIIGGRSNKNLNPLTDMYTLNLANNFWEITTPSGDGPVDASLYAAERIENFLYCIGSDFRNNFEMIMYLNLDELSWSEKKSRGVAPVKRSRHASCIYDNKILIIGGKTETTTSASTSIMPMMDVHLLSVTNRKFQWEDILSDGAIPTARYGHELAVRGTSIYMFGGQSGSKITNEMKVLVNLKWKQLDPGNKDQSPSARLGATGSVLEHRLFIVGGAVNNHPTNEIFILDSNSMTWDNPAMYGLPPPALVGHTAGVVGAEIFVFGGGDGETPINDLYVIDTVSLKWIKPPTEGTQPHGGVGCTMVACGLRLVVYGGFGNREYSKDVTVLDTATMTWSHPLQRGDPLPSPRVAHTSTLLNQTDMFVFGGSLNGKAMKDTWCLDVKTFHWDRYINKGTVPYNRFGHAAAAVGQTVYIFGGSIKYSGKKGEEGTMGVDYRASLGNDLYVMEPKKLETYAFWTRPVLVGVLPQERYRHVLSHVNGVIFLFSGSHGNRALWGLDTGSWEASTGQGPSAQAARDPNREEENNEDEEERVEEMINIDPQTQLMLKFLQELNLAKYNRVFLKQECDWKTLMRCNDQDLVDMGIRAIGPRKKILQKLSKLNATDLIDPEEVVSSMGKKSGKPELFEGRYEIVQNKEATSGSMGTAIRFATDIRTQKEVVLKFVRDYAEWDREIKFLRQLRTSGNEGYVVELIDYEEREQRKRARQVRRARSQMSEIEIEELNVPNPEEQKMEALATQDFQAEILKDGGQKTTTSAEVEFIPGTDKPLWDYYEPFSMPGFHWMALEKANMTLREFLRDTGVIYETQRKALFERMLLIIDHLAARRVVHADIKPENFAFFGDDMRLKLLDFGKSTRVDTMIVPVATPAYCSPEMAKVWVSAKKSNVPKMAKASLSMDVWAAGMIFFETYLGEPVLAGREDTYGLLAGPDHWIENLGWGMVDNVQAVHLLQKLLVKSTKRRPTAQELLKSPYLTWGLDTIQIDATFGSLQRNCEFLRQQLEEVKQDADDLQGTQT